MARPATPSGPPAAEVRAMFDRIAPRYEAMNTVMTLGLDAAWRRRAVRATRLGPGMAAVDVACGTGSLTRELARAVGTAGTVTGVDVSDGMLAEARRRGVSERAATAEGAARPEYLVGDALDLPLDDASVDAATIAFGLRNVADHRRCLAELARVTRPGGRVVVLEISTPRGRLGRVLAATWFARVVPLLGRFAGDAAAYGYLPDSVRRYPPPARIAAVMRDVGLVDVRWQALRPGGLVTLHVGRRA
ncbi:MAG TPA: ubiquinone/menaquinone biosynthesis methyltransferase [Candidatus Limnocylindria bacterium]|nr:ubiquinone/menaquinone biosynthesis methyltransferase [Candidatus Limnocylindria bacterium]